MIRRRFSRQELAVAVQNLGSSVGKFPNSEPHRVSDPIVMWPQLILRTNRITHIAFPEYRTHDYNDALTLCGLRVHHCNLQTCRCPDRHRARVFSVRAPSDNPVDCMTCLTKQARQEADGR